LHVTLAGILDNAAPDSFWSVLALLGVFLGIVLRIAQTKTHTKGVNEP
jgi:hypothetical protein